MLVANQQSKIIGDGYDFYRLAQHFSCNDLAIASVNGSLAGVGAKTCVIIEKYLYVGLKGDRAVVQTERLALNLDIGSKQGVVWDTLPCLSASISIPIQLCCYYQS
ncbi:MAG: hypothetical protein V7K47_25600 [Nostoc sp.]